MRVKARNVGWHGGTTLARITRADWWALGRPRQIEANGRKTEVAGEWPQRDHVDLCLVGGFEAVIELHVTNTLRRADGALPGRVNSYTGQDVTVVVSSVDIADSGLKRGSRVVLEGKDSVSTTIARINGSTLDIPVYDGSRFRGDVHVVPQVSESKAHAA